MVPSFTAETPRVFFVESYAHRRRFVMTAVRNRHDRCHTRNPRNRPCDDKYHWPLRFSSSGYHCLPSYFSWMRKIITQVPVIEPNPEARTLAGLTDDDGTNIAHEAAYSSRRRRADRPRRLAMDTQGPFRKGFHIGETMK